MVEWAFNPVVLAPKSPLWIPSPARPSRGCGHHTAPLTLPRTRGQRVMPSPWKQLNDLEHKHYSGIVSVSIFYKEEEDCLLSGLCLCGRHTEKCSHSDPAEDIQEGCWPCSLPLRSVTGHGAVSANSLLQKTLCYRAQKQLWSSEYVWIIHGALSSFHLLFKISVLKPFSAKGGNCHSCRHSSKGLWFCLRSQSFLFQITGGQKCSALSTK